MATTPCDPAALVAAARCDWCIPKSARKWTALYLLCNVTSKATPPCVTPDAPINSSGSKQITNTTIRVSWNQISNSGSLITSYTVKWGTASGVYTNSATVAVVPKVYTITGLSSGTQYFWAVQANSFSGCSSVNSNEGTGTTTGAAPGPCAAGTAFATAWAARVVVNGGAVPSAATQTAIANFQCGLITDGLDTQMIAWNAFVPDNLIAAITAQFISNGATDPFTNHNFVLGDLTVNGLTGNAATKYLETGLVVPAAFNASNGVVVYNYTANASGFEYGGYNGVQGILGAAKHTDNNTYSYSGATATNVVSLASPGNGYYSAQRVSTSDHRVYFANSITPHAQIGATDVTVVVGTIQNIAFNIMTVNLSGAPQFICSNTLSFIAFTTGLSAADSAKLFLRVQQLRTDLGGGFR